MPEQSEGSKEARKEELKQQIQETRGQIRSTRSSFDASMVDVLLTQSGDKLPDLIKVIKKTQSAALPVTRDTRRYLGEHEIAAGSRLGTDAYPVYKNLFEGLTVQAVSRLPHPKREKEGLITSIHEFHKHLFATKPAVPYHYTNREIPPEYKNAIKQAADLLAQINPEDETQKRELTFLFDTVYRWAEHISPSSQDYSDERKAKVAEDLFIEMLGRLKTAEQVPNQEDPEHDVSTTVSTMVSHSHSEESRLQEQLDQLWSERDRLDKRFA